MDYDAFIADDKTIDAVVRNFEIIGEAAPVPVLKTVVQGTRGQRFFIADLKCALKEPFSKKRTVPLLKTAFPNKMDSIPAAITCNATFTCRFFNE